MFLLLSGEGVSDMGACGLAADLCEDCDFQPGPMAVLVDQIAESKLSYSLLQPGLFGFVPEASLTKTAKKLATARKGLRLPGTKSAKETGYFFNNARALASLAAQEAKERQDEVVAVLFRDADGAASAGRGQWQDKRQSMLDGFAEAGFSKGVPMIPRPKSEAWILCGTRTPAYQNCATLESRSGNDRSPKALKAELAKVLSGKTSVSDLVNLVQSGKLDYRRIAMPSFQAFRDRLEDVL